MEDEYSYYILERGEEEKDASRFWPGYDTINDIHKQWVAEDAAEHYFYQHDGWEDSWPLTFVILLNGEKVGTFEIEIEHSPNFNATPKQTAE